MSAAVNNDTLQESWALFSEEEDPIDGGRFDDGMRVVDGDERGTGPSIVIVEIEYR